MKKTFSVLLFSFIGISFVYEGHAMLARTGTRGLTGIMEGVSRLNTLTKTVRPAASLAQSAFTIDPASAPSGMTGPLFGSSLVPTIKMHSDVFQGQPNLLDAVKKVMTTVPSTPSTSPMTTSVLDQVKNMPMRNLPPIKAPDLLDSGTDDWVLNKMFAGGHAQTPDVLQTDDWVLNKMFAGGHAQTPDVFQSESSFGLEDLFRDDVVVGQGSVVTQGTNFAKNVTLEAPKNYDFSGVKLAKSLPWTKILWSADMLRLESQQSGLAKAAFKVAAHHAVQYATSSLVDAAIMFFCPSFVALNPASFSLSSVWNLSQAVASYAFYGSVTANPLGLSAMSALQVAHFAYQNPEYVYMAGQTMNKATTFVSSLCGNPVIGLVTGGLSPFAASVADLGSSFAGDALKGVSRGVMNFNAMLVEKSITWLMSGASTVYSKLWAAPATEPVPAYA